MHRSSSSAMQRDRCSGLQLLSRTQIFSAVLSFTFVRSFPIGMQSLLTMEIWMGWAFCKHNARWRWWMSFLMKIEKKLLVLHNFRGFCKYRRFGELFDKKNWYWSNLRLWIGSSSTKIKSGSLSGTLESIFCFRLFNVLCKLLLWGSWIN